MRKIVFPLCLMAMSFIEPAMANPKEDNKDFLYTTGKEMFITRNWNGCLDRLLQLKQQLTDATYEINTDLTKSTIVEDTRLAYDANISLEDIDYMIAVSTYEKGKDYSVNLLKAFEKAYPVSAHIDEVRFLLGSRYFFDGDYAKAVSVYNLIDMGRVPMQYQADFCQRLGVSYLKIGAVSRAYPMFRVLDQMDSKYKSSAQYYLGYCLYVEGKYDQALRYFNNVPQTGEYALTVPYYIAQIDFIQGRTAKAQASALKLVKEALTDEQAAEMYRIAAITLNEEGQATRAFSYFKKYFEIVNQPAPLTAYQAGVCAYNAGELGFAKDAFSISTKEAGAISQRSYLYLGEVYLRLGEMRNAQMAFEKAAKMNDDPTATEAALFNYALALHKGGNSAFNESVTMFEQFLNKYPQSSFADLANDCLVESYMTSRNYESALNSINQIHRPGAKIREAKQRLLFQLATQYVANADMVMAKKYFDQAIALGSLNAETLAQSYFWRGESLYREAQYAKSEADFNNFLRLTRQKQNEIYALGYYNLAYSQFKQQEFDQAINSFDKYLAISSEKGKPTYADAQNRMGDIYFYKRQFERAKQFYAAAASQAGGSADYAVYQEAYMAGLQKNYTEKIALLKSIQQKWPNSEYGDDAMFELGKTYVTMDKPKEAIAAFESVAKEYPDGSLARKAGLQLGLLYFNTNQSSKAIGAYKHVISSYPSSSEARVAAEDLKAVYVELNDIPAYANYIKSLDGKVTFEAGEQDSLTYMATQRILARGNADASKKALQNYLQSADAGAFRLHALTELARLYFAEDALNESKTMYERILQEPNTQFTEEALARTADIYYTEKDYNTALDRFKKLEQVAEFKENKKAAKVGMMRSAVGLGDDKEIILASTGILNTSALSPDLQNEATYNRAKALIRSGKAKDARVDLEFLAKDTRVAQGAEAAYILAQQDFDEGNDKEAEKRVFALIDSATPHQYWLARGFILLSDIYIGRGDMFQAEQYLESLQNNYEGDDDIKEMISKRVKLIESQGNEQ